jgi:hypothetical protein
MLLCPFKSPRFVHSLPSMTREQCFSVCLSVSLSLLNTVAARAHSLKDRLLHSLW